MNGRLHYGEDAPDQWRVFDVAMSPLAIPEGHYDRRTYPECSVCRLRVECAERVINLQPFARPECNATLTPEKRQYTRRPTERQARIIALLRDYGESSTTRLAGLLGDGYHLVRHTLDAMCDAGIVLRVRFQVINHRRQAIWRLP